MLIFQYLLIARDRVGLSHSQGILQKVLLLFFALLFTFPAIVYAQEISVIVDTTRCTLTVFFDEEPLKEYPVALGRPETPTPIGNFQVIRKDMYWGSGFGSRWLGLNVPWGIYGIHGTNKPWSIGNYSSHGCIRMHDQDIEELFSKVSLGTKVIIVGNPFTYREPPYRELRRDFCGSDVMELQRIFTCLGLFKGKIDGIWREDMDECVYIFRQANGLSPDNVMDDPAYRALGLK